VLKALTARLGKLVVHPGNVTISSRILGGLIINIVALILCIGSQVICELGVLRALTARLGELVVQQGGLHCKVM